jgi:hypothetical protein
MSDDKRIRVRMALAILSGRKNADTIMYDDLEKLGYDSHKFSYYGRPDQAELRERAEDILLEAILGEP